MTRIPDEVLRSVVFLYDSEDAALDGRKPGGTGFIIQWPLGDNGALVRYLVTAAHVRAAGGRYARMNRGDGGVGVVEVPVEGWLTSFTPGDVAVGLLPLDKRSDWEFSGLLWNDWALTPAEIREESVGIGDEVVMLGRQVNFEGRDRNQPLARFGHIAMMPGEAIEDGRGMRVQAYLLEVRSEGGFSGSPVLLVIPPMSVRPNRDTISTASMIGLLGVNTGHVTANRALSRSAGSKHSADELFIAENLGLAIAAPIDQVTDLLSSDEAVEQRDLIHRSADLEPPPFDYKPVP